MSELIDYLQLKAKLYKSFNCDNKHVALHTKMFADAKDVVRHHLSDVLTKEQIRAYKTICRPQPKHCYKNALLFAQKFGCVYCEGLIGCHGVPIEHAFNRIGDTYIDPTNDFVLKDERLEYVSYFECSADEAVSLTEKKGTYGNLYEFKNLDVKLL